MIRRKLSWAIPVVCCALAVCIGCKNETSTDNGPDTVVEPEPDATTVVDPEPEVPAAPAIPEVRMTEELAATCLVRNGDVLPNVELPDLQGNPHSLSELKGEKLTVVFFWTSGNEYSLAELQDLTVDVAEPYLEKGVRVIGVNEGDSAEVVAEQAEKAGVRFPILLDPGGLYFAKVAKEKLPRTYVLDANGVILWFDMEYSEITREELQQTIKVALGEI